MSYLPGLSMALGLIWLALSGETAPLFVGLGILSVLLVLWISARLRIIGRDASPYHRTIQLLFYFGWLAIEIVKSNVAVIVRVLGPKHAIDPDVVRVRSDATSDLGRALFANSITLTPGTVTVDIEGASLIVHTLVREQSRAGAFEAMDRRAARVADPPVAAQAAAKAGKA
jgi:multicomponent Na+:H+ antiporter subunit E